MVNVGIKKKVRLIIPNGGSGMPENEMLPHTLSRRAERTSLIFWVKNECNLVFVENLPDFRSRIKANTFINMSPPCDGVANI